LRHAVNYLEEIKGNEVTTVVHMQADCPIREKKIIDRAILILSISPRFDSIVTVREIKDKIEWAQKINGLNLYPYKKEAVKYRRQELENLYQMDGHVHVIKRNVLMRRTVGLHKWLGENISYIIQEEKYGMNIDTEWDFQLAELILNADGHRKEEEK